MIIHFTNDFEKLLSIISSNSFRLRYCGEYFGDKKGRIVSRAAHPMVSFSSYTHEELPSKIVTYGGYGIALSKTWAIENSLSPVNYIDKNSPIAQGLIALLKSRQLGTLPKHLRLPVIQLKCFTKHVYGYNSHFKVDDFDFHSESEWRYVPTIKQIKGNRISVNFSSYNKNNIKYNSKLRAFPLKFSFKDIKYIYVTNKYERNKIISLFNLNKNQVILTPWVYNNEE
ncbi:TPA: hypothetical protein GNA48_000040 [Salmonella enterica subsp. houtenae serovar 21:z4,z23:-]|uniref:Uncharacterized protein n=1 Tax=Salmonella enterica subsp. houtenae serovar 21:z4,z23:- TaxID=1967606 RepID=A0A752IKU5_SALHO|nr:hypothetical protein [Salmonella enterica subsp. houtenae serovar 21:z4,z23:-]